MSAYSAKSAVDSAVESNLLRELDAIDQIEARHGKPVVTSNQAATWLALRTMGISESVPGAGRLLTLPL